MAGIAIEAGFRYGAQLPDTLYFPLYFADQDWRKSNRAAYMAALERHRPTMATVLDWERPEQLPEVLSWAEQAAQYVERVLIVPKVIGGVGQLPRQIGGREVVLAYSVPTKYAGSEVPLWELNGWPVHLLGGSPHRQMAIWSHLMPIANVVSVDGNFAHKLAVNYCRFWTPGNAYYSDNRWQATLDQAGNYMERDGCYEAFRRSCVNIAAAWRQLAGE